MKILVYNWSPDFDVEKRGGGVRIYQENLITELARDESIDLFTLYSGLSYTFFQRKPFYRQLDLGLKNVSAYELVNSSILSPAHLSFGRNDELFLRCESFKAFAGFLDEFGPFDVIHFNNFEGLPLSVLELKERYPNTKFLYSIHNYYAVCPQVNLWSHESAHCDDFNFGHKCPTCVAPPHRREVLAAHRFSWILRQIKIKPHTWIFRKAFSILARMKHSKFQLLLFPYYKLDEFIDKKTRHNHVGSMNTKKIVLQGFDPHNSFYRRRVEAVALINKYVDLCIAVSNRTGVVSAKFGIEPSKIRISYIGTQHAQHAHKFQKRTNLAPGEKLSICYMGYMRRDKGFYFLLEALALMPVEMAKNIRIKIIAPITDNKVIDKIKLFAPRFDYVELVNGYSHKEITDLLCDVHLGVVPVLWEDNLPQVAIEIVSRGIPIITSDRGGAQELGGCNDKFIFKSGDAENFNEKIQAILGGKVNLNEYWSRSNPLVDMKSHVSEIKRIYLE